jgi:lipopolysaccharide export system permease protein
MRIARTLSLYVIRETSIHCALAFFLLTFVLITQNLLRRLEELFLVGMTAQDLGIVLMCVFPVVISYSLPLAFLVGILLALQRLGSDGELEGMRAAGIGPSMLLAPLLVLGLLTSGVSLWLMNSVEHESRRELVRLFKSVAARGAIIEPGKFRYIGPRLIFVEDRDRSGGLHGIMIYDETRSEQPYRIFAAHGRFRFLPDTSEILLELSEGDVHFSPDSEDPGRYERIRFEEFVYRVNVGHILGRNFGPVRPKQMEVSELREVLDRAERGDPLRELDQRDPIEYELEIHRRRALPLAPLVFAGIGVPMALASEGRGRALSIVLCLAGAFGYYALGALAEMGARDAWLGASLAAWIPNLVFGVLAIVLVAARRDRIPR